MDLATILGLVFGFGALLAGFVIEHGDIKSLYQLSPIIIVIGGTLSALMIGYGIKDFVKLPKIFLSAVRAPKSAIPDLIEQLSHLSETARKEGLLSLENVMLSEEFKKADPFLVSGIMMVVDGTDAEEIQDRLDNEIYIVEQKRKGEISMFEAAGGLSPTLGIIGTVMGLIQVLSNMGTPEDLAKSISVAFIATLYGVVFANLVYIPIANKLKYRLKFYKFEKEMIITGVMGIRNGENPKMLRERLSTFLLLTDEKPKGSKKGAKETEA